MHTVGIICEYNPFHLGHRMQFQKIREQYGEDTAIVCLMSGNFVQRGAPAIFDKCVRAKAAVLSGADLVLELPVGFSLSSAEGFAAGGVEILSRCCDVLSFGTEGMDRASLLYTAQALLREDFPEHLKAALSSGCSFPAARQAALEKLGAGVTLKNPNDILGVEYCKAILQQGSSMDISPVLRDGDYHSTELDPGAPSASAVRRAVLSGIPWQNSVPEEAASLYEAAPVHTLKAGERAILARLRTMTDADFEALPYGSEGLWRKLMKASRSQAALEDIVTAVKSKRYTRTRIDRMLLCAFLGLTAQDIGTPCTPVRVLGFTDRGRSILRLHPEFRNVGEEVSELENTLSSLYGLFCTDLPEKPGMEAKQRVFYHRGHP